jgi:hypothetical protein
MVGAFLLDYFDLLGLDSKEVKKFEEILKQAELIADNYKK